MALCPIAKIQVMNRKSNLVPNHPCTLITPSKPPDATASDRNASPTDLQHASGQESGLTEDMESQQGTYMTVKLIKNVHD